jgi:protein SCO1/2
VSGEDAVPMPPRYFADSVITSVKNGKTRYDTVWHQIPGFAFSNQLGETITTDAFKGKILVVNTFFTRCPNICPGLTRNVRKLQQSFENPKRKKYGDSAIVYFLSFSVDPARDSVQALKRWADRFHVNSDNWSLLTGSKDQVYDLLLNEFKMAVQGGDGVDSNFIHSEKVMLLDRDRVIRGFYNGLDSVAMGKLATDIGRLYLERDRNKPSLFRQYIPLLPVLATVPLIVLVGLWFINRSRKYDMPA